MHSRIIHKIIVTPHGCLKTGAKQTASAAENLIRPLIANRLIAMLCGLAHQCLGAKVSLAKTSFCRRSILTLMKRIRKKSPVIEQKVTFKKAGTAAETVRRLFVKTYRQNTRPLPEEEGVGSSIEALFNTKKATPEKIQQTKQP